VAKTYWFIRKAGTDEAFALPVVRDRTRYDAALVFTKKELADGFLDMFAEINGSSLGEAVSKEGDDLLNCLQSLRSASPNRPACDYLMVDEESPVFASFQEPADLRSIGEFRRAHENQAQ